MKSDSELLDWLDHQSAANGMKIVFRWSTTGRGWRLHQDPDGEYETVREAIQSAMEIDHKYCFKAGG